jgi:hypothetical protein
VVRGAERVLYLPAGELREEPGDPARLLDPDVVEEVLPLPLVEEVDLPSFAAGALR